METLKILALAVLQGVAEFLPISSSGHLAIAQRCFGIDAPGNTLEILLHFGTLLAVVWFYRVKLAMLLLGVLRGSGDARRQALSLILGCIPAVAAYLCFGDFFEKCFDRGIGFTGAMLVVTGLVLLSLKFVRKSGGKGEVGFGRALLVGVAQAVALLPGISRSGSTIAVARHLGVEADKAAEFSFLMSVPLLAGAAATPFLHRGASPLAGIGAAQALLAVAVSAITGYFALRFLVRTLAGGRFWMFGIYCLAAGAAAIIFA